MKVNRSIVVRGGVSLVFIGLLVSLMLKPGFLEQLRDVDLLFLGLSLGLSVVMVSASTWKWWLLLDQQGVLRSFGELVRVYLIGYYFSNLLPSNFGGDVVRSYTIGRRCGDQTKVAVSVFLERFTGLILLLVLVVVMPFFSPDGLLRSPLFFVPAFGAVGLLVVACMAWFMAEPSRWPRAVGMWLLRGLAKVPGCGGFSEVLFRSMEKLCGGLDGFHVKLTEAGREIRRAPRYAVPVVLLTMLFYGFTLVNVYLAFRAFGVVPDFQAMACVVPTAMMVAMLPVGVLGNAGFLEFTFIGYFTSIGFLESEVLAMSLLLRMKMLLLGVLGLPFYLSSRSEVDEVRKKVQGDE